MPDDDTPLELRGMLDDYGKEDAELAKQWEDMIRKECVAFQSNLSNSLLEIVKRRGSRRSQSKNLLHSSERSSDCSSPLWLSSPAATAALFHGDTGMLSNESQPTKPSDDGANRPSISALARQGTMYSGATTSRGKEFHMNMEHGGILRQLAYKRCSGLIDWWLALEEPPRESRLAHFVLSRFFEILCAAVILCNGAFAIYATNLEVKDPSTPPPSSIGRMEIAFLIFYSIELSLKLFVHRLFFFCNVDMKWNIFDLTLVGFTLVDIAITTSSQVPGANMDVTFMRSLRLLKLAKILRMVRVMRFFAELRVILNSLMGSFVSLFWSLLMLALIFYIFGLLFVQGAVGYLTGDHVDPTVEANIYQYYGSVQLAMLTLFKATTGGDDWSQFYDTLAYTGTLNTVLFMFFIAFMQVALMNILTGIFVENALKLAQPDRDALALDLRKQEKEFEAELRRLCKELDTTESGRVSKEDLAMFLEQSKTKAYLAVLGLDIKDAELFFGMLANATGEDDVHMEAFIQGCMRLKGHATSLDIQLLVYAMNSVQSNVNRVQRDVHKIRLEVPSMVAQETAAIPPACRNPSRSRAYREVGTVTESSKEGSTLGSFNTHMMI
eukprot:TRINITY_DN29120_c0_g1_i1.p1 TRINITY_DN29120_c0_g1~~TRINITY_DN29120_c0_g1_i1.p1  ORF type:complete len:610 (-),score=103.14 TRINITY_DN29120_c0_g1_i1:251-2080(-)